MKKIDITSNIKPKKNNDLNILTSGAFAAPLFEILKVIKITKVSNFILVLIRRCKKFCTYTFKAKTSF